ncbi:hypothetical protein Hanom_Chr05g00404951 [Helianthus anomalus]
MGSFVEILKFIEDIRIHKALIDQHKYYESHVRAFWNNAHYVEDDKTIQLALKMKDENEKDIDVAVKITVGDIRRVLDLKDKDKDSIHVPEKLCKGLWFRKGGYDESAHYIMKIITCLILNRSYNISQMIFNHMLDNIKGERSLQYPRFVQMLLDDQIPNLSKAGDDELVLDHMDTETLKRLDVYRGIEKGKMPKFRKKFAAIEKSDYQAPEDDKWRHDNSDYGTETKKMKLFEPKKTRWWVKKHDKKKKSDDHENFSDEIENIIVDQDASKVAEKAGGEKSGKNIEVVKETLVEGEIHTDSSETESEIDVTQIAPTTYVSGKIKLKGPSSKKERF